MRPENLPRDVAPGEDDGQVQRGLQPEDSVNMWPNTEKLEIFDGVRSEWKVQYLEKLPNSAKDSLNLSVEDLFGQVSPQVVLYPPI